MNTYVLYYHPLRPAVSLGVLIVEADDKGQAMEKVTKEFAYVKPDRIEAVGVAWEAHGGIKVANPMYQGTDRFYGESVEEWDHRMGERIDWDEEWSPLY